jgi:hypothetical protein
MQGVTVPELAGYGSKISIEISKITKLSVRHLRKSSQGH